MEALYLAAYIVLWRNGRQALYLAVAVATIITTRPYRTLSFIQRKDVARCPAETTPAHDNDHCQFYPDSMMGDSLSSQFFLPCSCGTGYAVVD